jgi:hypothetical protein
MRGVSMHPAAGERLVCPCYVCLLHMGSYAAATAGPVLVHATSWDSADGGRIQNLEYRMCVTPVHGSTCGMLSSLSPVLGVFFA